MFFSSFFYLAHLYSVSVAKKLLFKQCFLICVSFILNILTFLNSYRTSIQGCHSFFQKFFQVFHVYSRFLKVQCFLANPAGFSRKVDLFTLAFNTILLQKSIQLRFNNQASNILLRHNKSTIYINLCFFFILFPLS